MDAASFVTHDAVMSADIASPCADPAMVVDDPAGPGSLARAFQSLSMDDDAASELAASEPASATSTWITQPTFADARLPAIHEQAPRLRINEFEVYDTLGTGTFGKVLLVRHKNASPDPRFFALKVLRKSDVVRLRQADHVNAERYLLLRVNHPFIVRLWETFKDHLNIYMLMDYVPGGELFSHLRRAKRFSPDVTRFYLATIVLALEYLHKRNIVYRDLKPENLLLDRQGYLQITDFGFAKLVEDRTWTLCGTPEYLAPEVIQSAGHGKAVDWWACGILMYEMLVGYPPFFDETAFGIYEKILRGNPHFPRHVDLLSKGLIEQFLHPDLTKRLGNLIGGAQDVKDHPWFRGVDWVALERKDIRAPIVPYVDGLDDTRNYTSQRVIPPPRDIPGLYADPDAPAPELDPFDPDAFLFIDF